MGCNHVFCIEVCSLRTALVSISISYDHLQCLRQWRDPQGKSGDVVHSGVTKRCPLCRAPSQIVIPSSQFFRHGSSRKEAATESFKASMARTPCRSVPSEVSTCAIAERLPSYFEKSKNTKPFCPFGKDCFYRHVKDDGSPFVFSMGVDHYMKVRIVYSPLHVLRVEISADLRTSASAVRRR